MAVPKRKTSPSRRGKRRAHDSLKHNYAISSNNTTGAPKMRHHLDSSYHDENGRYVLARAKSEVEAEQAAQNKEQ